MKRMSFMLALLIALAAPALAQIQGGSINGTIKDEQGGVLPGVTVTAQGLDATHTFVTEAAGEYRFLNLAPGPYRFRVMASNSERFWNGAEATVGVDIEPATWQTRRFRLMSALAGALVLIALYRMRLHRLTHQLSVRFEERLAERTRIAQELHDTLLQGFLSASMQLHLAVDRMPESAFRRAPALMKRQAPRGARKVGWYGEQQI